MSEKKLAIRNDRIENLEEVQKKMHEKYDSEVRRLQMINDQQNERIAMMENMMAHMRSCGIYRVCAWCLFRCMRGCAEFFVLMFV